MTLSPLDRRRAVLSYVECEAGRIYAGEVSLGGVISAAMFQVSAAVGEKIAIPDYVLQEYKRQGEYEMVTVRLGACVAFQPDRIHAEIVEAAGRVLSSVSVKLAERSTREELLLRGGLEANKNNALPTPHAESRKRATDALAAHLRRQWDATEAGNEKAVSATGKHVGLAADRNSTFGQLRQKLASEERSRPTSPLWEVKPAKPTKPAKPANKDSLQKHGLMGRIAIGIVLLCIFLTLTMTGRVIISTTLGKF